MRVIRHTCGVALLAIVALAPVGAAEPPTALDQNGRGHAWQGAIGQLTLIDFAASWCVPCRKTLPRLEKFAAAHPDLRVLTVSVDERREGRDELVASLRLTLPMLWDEGQKIAAHYQPGAMPAAFLVAPDGAILHTELGSRDADWDAFVKVIEAALLSQAGAAPASPPGGTAP